MSKIAAGAEMLIRKPPSDIFNALTDPRALEKFWLNSASGPLAKDAVVEWEFLVPGAREIVTVTEFITNQVIVFVWSDGIAVTIKLDSRDSLGTRVSVTATGFTGTDGTSQALNATQGFTIVLCDLKSLLETGQSGNMVRDKAALITADKAEA